MPASKKMYAEERLKAENIKEAIEKSGKAVAPTRVSAKIRRIFCDA